MKKITSLKITLTLMLVLLPLTSFTSWVQANPKPSETRGTVLYASPGGAGTCTSWADTCNLQAALTAAVATDEIWAEAGTYLPTGTSIREVSFILRTGVAIYGGFAGTETAREQRDWVSNITILSGDIGVVGNSSDNSYQVVKSSMKDATAILDGFTITAGNANGPSADGYGGGMYNDQSNPTLINLTFSTNSADFGGGMYNDDHSNPMLSNVTFSENSSNEDGGGMFNLFSNPILTNVTFSDNSAVKYGGGMGNFESSPTLTNVTFSDNSAIYGGGMYNLFSNPSLTNVTFSGNTAHFFGGGIYNSSATPTLTNAILWGNLPDQVYNNTSTPVITYSDIQGGYTGEGNINIDPLLGPLADNGGFTLTHALLPGSPAIDTGSPSICPATDQRGITRPIDGDENGTPRCDMGAYEYEPVIYYNFLPFVLQ